MRKNTISFEKVCLNVDNFKDLVKACGCAIMLMIF